MVGGTRNADLRTGRRLQIVQAFSIILLWMMMMMSIGIAMGAPAEAPTTAAAPDDGVAAAPPPIAAAAPPLVTAKPSPPPLPVATNASAPTPPANASAPAPPANANATAPKASPPVVAAAPPPKSSAIPPKAAPPPTSSTNHTSAPPASAPNSKHTPAAPAPKAATPTLPPANESATPTDLDISQIAALQQLKVPFDQDIPCNTPDDILLCDNTDPPRHLISLSLHDCPPNANFSTAALRNLSSLQSLELVNCSAQQVHVPSALIVNLKTFICSESLGRTALNQRADKLSGAWLAKLTSLEELSVNDVEVSSSGLHIIVQNMKVLTHLVVSRTNLPGILPRNTWPHALEYIDISGNSIRGTLPSQMRSLVELKYLDLSDNQIKGELPNIFGDLQQLQYIDLSGNQFSGRIPGSFAYLRNCSHIDLSNNRLNGSIPANITLIETLTYLDLSQNELSGPVPFNATFLDRLTTLKLADNTGLCYNHTELKSKWLTGIPNCVSIADDPSLLAPAPAPASSDLSASSGKSQRISTGAVAGISVAAIVCGAAAVFLARKWWKSRDDSDHFVDMRKDRP